MSVESRPEDVTAPDDGAVAMSVLARTLRQYHDDLEKTLTAVAEAAVGTVPGASSAGISLQSGPKRLETRWATSELPSQVAEAQSAAEEGPCLEAIETGGPVRVDDLGADRRWPAFVARIEGGPTASMVTVPLMLSGTSIGSLSVYSADREAFDRSAEDTALVLAGHAAVAIAAAQEEEGLRTALAARDVIGQAKGILMERYKLSADEAFTLLVRSSQRTNVKLREVAEEIATTGAIPAG